MALGVFIPQNFSCLNSTASCPPSSALEAAVKGGPLLHPAKTGLSLRHLDQEVDGSVAFEEQRADLGC